MEKLSNIIRSVDDFVWGPFMLVLLVGTGIFLTIRLHFLPWRNLGYALKMTLSKEARTTREGTGDISPFSALTTALAATIRDRQYCRRCDCYGLRRTWSAGLDVDIRMLRTVLKIQRVHAVHQIP